MSGSTEKDGKIYKLAFVNEARKYFNNFRMIQVGDHATY